jgi:hypothetical protein
VRSSLFGEILDKFTKPARIFPDPFFEFYSRNLGQLAIVSRREKILFFRCIPRARTALTSPPPPSALRAQGFIDRRGRGEKGRGGRNDLPRRPFESVKLRAECAAYSSWRAFLLEENCPVTFFHISFSAVSFH